jgi:hypothetical protein
MQDRQIAPLAPPTPTLPLKGGGSLLSIAIKFPSPLKGEGRVGVMHAAPLFSHD